MLPLLAMGRDVPGGRMRLRGDVLELDGYAEASREYYDDVEAAARDLARRLGGRLRFVSRKTTVHPLGGCPMGRNVREGVVGTDGEVFGAPGLFIADGSIMPGPVGVNPSLTIAALAHRIAEGIARR